MIIHVLGVPHTITSKQFTTCAFTQKVLKLCAMMHHRGHTVYHYGTEGSQVACTEHISLVTREEWERAYPHPGSQFYNHSKMDGEQGVYLKKWSDTLKTELAKRSGPPGTEIVCLTWGGAQRDGVVENKQFHVESGIGYPSSWAEFRVYESYAWMHMHLGRDNFFGGEKWYFCVIPNSFDLSDFRFNANRGEDFLFIGRLNIDKGVSDAVKIAKDCGRKITIVGQGDPTPYLDSHVTYLPPVDTFERAKLLSECRAVICPTRYVEPFAGVNVEAQLSGAPVITTDWGAFAETVLHGKTGYRCRTYEQFLWAAKNIHRIDPHHCRQWAEDNYSLERVALMYEEFFQQVLNIRTNTNPKTEGMYASNPNRTQLDWMVKRYSEFEDPISLSIKHEPPPEPERDAQWQEANHWESDWWGLEWNRRWDEEIEKQAVYFRCMGAPDDLDFGQKRILDVGCGPVSMLQRSVHGFARGVDPLPVTDVTKLRYRDRGAQFLNIKAEEMPVDMAFDETWMYNCLQHTDNPREILKRICDVSREVRIFEWLDTGLSDGHIHSLTEELFNEFFPKEKWVRKLWTVGVIDYELTLCICWGRCIALHVEKRQ